MGLDLIELIMNVEDAFETEIPDEDAQHLNTPRKLANYIISHLNNKGNKVSTTCVTQLKFYALRFVLMREFRIARRNIRPDTSFEQLFQDQPMKQWLQLNKSLGDIINLEYQSFIGRTTAKAPRFIKTVKDLIPFIQLSPVKWQNDSGLKTILQRIIHITSEQLDIPVDQIHPDADFARDLGAST